MGKGGGELLCGRRPSRSLSGSSMCDAGAFQGHSRRLRCNHKVAIYYLRICDFQEGSIVLKLKVCPGILGLLNHLYAHETIPVKS
jgi:hypothetical protein